MNKMMHILAAALVLAGPAAFAQEEGPRISVGLLAAQGDAASLAQRIWGGYTFEAGYRFVPEGYGASFMPYVGWGKLPGDKHVPDRAVGDLGGEPNSLWGNNSYNLTCWRAGFDIRIQPTARLPLTIAFGPSIHFWDVQRIGVAEDPRSDTGPKLGWRMGLTYAITPQWEAGAYYTMSESRSRQDVKDFPGYVDDSTTPSHISGLNPSRPNYFTFMATYRF